MVLIILKGILLQKNIIFIKFISKDMFGVCNKKVVLAKDSFQASYVRVFPPCPLRNYVDCFPAGEVDCK